MKKENDEVVYADTMPVVVSKADVAFLKDASEKNPRRRMRLCAHRDPSDTLHEMFIVHEKDTYVRPHRHFEKAESVHVVEGEVDIVLFDDNGGIKDVIRMGDYSSGKTFYYRLSIPLFHTLIIRTSVLVFHETTTGPFTRSGSSFPAWAPDESDRKAQREFMDKTARAADAFLGAKR